MSDNGSGMILGRNGPAGVGQDPGRERRAGRRSGDRLVVASGALQEIVDESTTLARSAKPLLISGPSGSGRRHLARAIHDWSQQSGTDLVETALNGLSAEQQVASLCGGDDRQGDFARAAETTLLIPNLEGACEETKKLLFETIQSGSYRRGGNAEAMSLRARVIATAGTEAVESLASLGMHPITIPSLGDRPEDILPLATHFLAEVSAAEGSPPVGFTGDARRWLIEEPWLGNARELRERVRQAVRLSGNGALSAEALMLSTEGDDVPSFKEAKRAFETRYVEGLLRRCSGNISRAARLAKKDRKDFYDVIRRTGVEPKNFRS